MLLIDIEGIDGTGKTTISRLLEDNLRCKGYQALYLKEPSSSDFGRKFVELSVVGQLTPMEEYELLFKDREIDVKTRILPALSSGIIVIMDRYFYSHVYQAAYGLALDFMFYQNRLIAPEPDVVVILDIPVKEAIKRIKGHRVHIDKFEEEEYLEKVRGLYLALRHQNNVCVVDAINSINVVLSTTVAAVTESLNKYASTARLR